MTKQYSCPAEKLIDTSNLIEVDGYNLQDWNLEDISDLKKMFEDDGIALELSYTDDEGYIYQFEFSVKALEKAVILGNVITLFDNEGAETEIKCFNLTPNTLKD